MLTATFMDEPYPAIAEDLGRDRPDARPAIADGPNEFLERQNQFESNARSYPRRLPIALQRGQGMIVTDTQGREYFDCLAGAGALALGHHHPVVVEAIQRCLADSLPLQTLDLTTPVKDKFVDELFATLPAQFARHAKIQFCGPSGSDAIEASIKLVKTATERRTLLAFHGAYHGMTHGSLSLTGDLGAKQPISGLMPDVQFLPFPYTYRCPFRVGGELSHRISSQYLETLLDDPNSGVVSPAGLILEVIQGEGGVIPAPIPWLQEVRRITRERGIPLIIDEVQTGLGRTGRWYAFEHAGIVPDVLVLSKAIGGGLPLSVVVYHKDLDLWQPGAHAGTFRGNQLAMATGTATIQFIRQERLWIHAENRGQQLMSALKQLAGVSRTIGDVRGQGLMIGVEIVDRESGTRQGASPPCFPVMARRIQQECLRRGLIVELGGRHNSVVRFLPPLIVTHEQIDAIAARFADAVLQAEASSEDITI